MPKTKMQWLNPVEFVEESTVEHEYAIFLTSYLFLFLLVNKSCVFKTNLNYGTQRF